MSAAALDPAGVACDLRRLANDPAVSRRDAACALALADRFDRPVCVGLLGLAGSGHRSLANALCGAALIGPEPGWPTTEARHAGSPGHTATLPDGSRTSAAGLPDPARLTPAPVFLQIEAPLPALRRMSLLAVNSSADLSETAAALAWAARRIDIAIWCSAGWTAGEAALWQAAPDALKHHAVLAITGGGPVPATGGDFATAIGLPPQADPARLADALADLIDEARAADLDAARLLLRKYGGAGPEAGAAQARPAEIVPFPSAATPAPQPAGRDALGRAFAILRNEARTLLAALEDPADGASPDTILRGIEATIAAVAEMLGAEAAAVGSGTGIAAALDQAAEMALLLRYEGGEAQAADAAALLLQLRREIEWELAA